MVQFKYPIGLVNAARHFASFAGWISGNTLLSLSQAYSSGQGEEELHDDEIVDKLIEGQIIERAGEYWKIIEMHTMVVATDPERVDVVNVFLEGPKTVRQRSKM